MGLKPAVLELHAHNSPQKVFGTLFRQHRVGIAYTTTASIALRRMMMMMMVVDSAWALFLRQQQQCFVCVYGARLAQDIAYRARGAQCASAAATRF